MRLSVRSGSVVGVLAIVGIAAATMGAARVGPHIIYTQHNLVSDGFVPADFTDPNMVNAWGLVPNPTAFWWVANAETGTSTLYDGDGNIQSLVVSIPSTGGPGTQGEPTGIVFNPTTDFVITDGTNSGAAAFLFAGEDGVISGWSPAVPPPPPSKQAFIAVDSSPSGAIYKGLALAVTRHGNRLYATDFHNGKVDAFDGQFNPIFTGGFVDPTLPAGYAPFGIAFLNEKVYVTYAKQDAAGEDDVPGPGFGYINVFSATGKFVRRLVSQAELNAPWGLALAPADFTGFGNQLMVGNFGDGRINVYDPIDGRHRGLLKVADGTPIEIDGLWGLSFGNGGSAGPKNQLFFTAGPDDEAHGLFGRFDVTIGS
jgi:uncharacterized protein (TIGR03118 family)